MLHRNGRDLSIAKAVMQPMKKKLTMNSELKTVVFKYFYSMS